MHNLKLKMSCIAVYLCKGSDYLPEPINGISPLEYILLLNVCVFLN